ncbi:hypothetical protein BDW02DRAFT_170419 [Decorospora gaudefroyi]|uniref:Uncharacterized protein n=1 Tax=Decorospora gaudefroyi TaxID=184978 RepID=A0A6A5JZQ5_9PLEO|nr:hypothetical protein BDW02DRAFT_170419 [Decorospora gaudefroyi]
MFETVFCFFVEALFSLTIPQEPGLHYLKYPLSKVSQRNRYDDSESEKIARADYLVIVGCSQPLSYCPYAYITLMESQVDRRHACRGQPEVAHQIRVPDM